MELKEFKAMCKADQLDYFWEKGEYVDSIKGNPDCILFRVDEKFYVDLEADTGIIYAFTKSPRLNKYLQKHEILSEMPWD